MLKILKKSKFKLFGWLWLFAGYAFHMWYEIGPGKWMVDADMSSEIILANLLNKEHALISKNWCYSSEIRFFSSQWIYRVGLLLFPNNWPAARIFSAAVFLIIILAAFFFFAKAIKLGDYAVWVAGTLMWPLGRWYFIYVLYGHYYVVYIIVTLLVLGLLFRLVDAGKKWHFVLELMALVVLSLLSGLNGIKQTFTFFAPLMLAFIFFFIIKLRASTATTLKGFVASEKKDVGLFVFSVLSVAVNMLGYLINSTVLSKNYVFKNFNDMVIFENNPHRVYDILKEYFFQFSNVHDVPLMSLSGIGAVCGIGLSLVLIWSYIRLIVNFKSLSTAEAITVLTLFSSILVNTVFYCVAGNYKQYYWLPIFPISILMIFLAIKHEKITSKSIKDICLGLVIFLVMVSGVVCVKDDINKPLMSRAVSKNDYIDVTNFLLEEGYTEGYASFWSSNLLTEMSSGKIETWTLFNANLNAVIYEFNQKKIHAQVEPQGKCFLLINSNEDGNPLDSNLIAYGDCEKVYEKDNLSVWIYKSGKAIHDAADKAYEEIYG